MFRMHQAPTERTTLPTSSGAGAVGKATRTRYWLVVFAIVLAVIQYIDRVCISQTMPDMARELQLTDRQRGAVFSAFGLAYALFEIPTGWLGDKIGARKVLLRVVLWWSFFTAATGWIWSYTSLLITRFLFGAGEAGCFPNLTKAFSSWLPRVERTRVQATMWMGARWGGAFTPLLVVAVMSFASWRVTFAIFASLGVAWAVVFAWWFRDNPRDHSGVNAAELELLKESQENLPGHGNVPWALFLSRPTVWLMWIQYFCLSYGWYFYITWLPEYLRDARGTDLKSNAFMSWLSRLLEGPLHLSPEITPKVLAAALVGIPLFFGGFGSLISGTISNRLIARGVNLTKIRRSFAFVGFTGAACLLMLSYYIKDPLYAMLAMGFASFCNDLTMPGAWSTCMDVGGKFAGTVSGSMNMMGNFGGMLCPLAVGFILQQTHRDWHLTFVTSSVIYLLGGLCWFWIDPVTPLEKPEPAEAGLA